jgi:hypothetical protein
MDEGVVGGHPGEGQIKRAHKTFTTFDRVWGCGEECKAAKMRAWDPTIDILAG